MKKWVYTFDEVSEAEALVGDWDSVRGLLGGKGANLADMTRLSVPVPPGFTVTTEACNAYTDADLTTPEGMWDQVRAALDHVEEKTGKKFGDPANPLLVSCRSGAKFSMPGMMDTVLDIGLNHEVAASLSEISGDEHFSYDSYRRLIQMFGSVVLGNPDEPYEEILEQFRTKTGVATDAELPTDALKDIVERFLEITPRFPSDPDAQLKLAVEAVFKSWSGKRAVDYRNASNIPHDLGTAVNVQTMVFGNLGEDCLTGVAMSRHGATGENHIEGDYLFNAQGEDVVAGIRATIPVSQMATDMPKAYEELLAISNQLEDHYRDMQDMEFTVENKKLWLLQTRDGKRTAQAAVRIAVELVEEGKISKEEAVMRVTPDQIDFFLHPQFSVESRKEAKAAGNLLAEGLNVSPGAAVGKVAFDADTAVEWAEAGEKVMLVRPETKPDDVHGMLAAEGIVTSRGGRTSHAALVARQFGKPAVVGIAELEIDLEGRSMAVDDRVIAEGEYVSIEGTSGEVFVGELPTVIPDINDKWLSTLLGWADEFRRLRVLANADYPTDANRAKEYGAQGIGLCRTEHMFFEAERLPIVQKMILAETAEDRQVQLDILRPMQREDFRGLFEAMSGMPVIIRMIDPPLHEFLPGHDELEDQLHDLEDAKSTNGDEIKEVERKLGRVDDLHEENPMLGFRGVRLGILMPEIPRMQARAIIAAACDAKENGFDPKPEIMIPLSIHVKELERVKAIVVEAADEIMKDRGITVEYQVGTMVETPRAALTAGPLAREAEFFSFGTNDLTQTTFAISRDDAEKSFLIDYVEAGILPVNPFQTLDRLGVGGLIKIAVEGGRKQRPGMEIGICGEHGGDPDSVALCHEFGLDYVSCSPFRVPVARLAAAHAAINDKG
ncbi:MAG: pyruvate, phosphate dikinase [bacterium]|nr:pyruvate, phosphate dikinase [bacterium]MCP4965474.1 pyruvate, phosphate dikinase [bacterium]